MDHSHEPRLADFSERALAFTTDYALFALGWALTLKALDSSEPLGTNPLGPLVTLIFTALFVVYQAYFSCEGRVSLGKRLLGLRIVGLDNHPLDLPHAVVRSIGYLVSQVLTAGFFWSLFDPLGRTWHDLPIGSLVVTERPEPRRRLGLTRFATGALLLLFAASWGWKEVWEPRYDKLMTVAEARSGLDEFSQLQRSYKRRHGRYANNIFALSTVSVDPGGFLRGAAALYDHGRVAFKVENTRFIIVARANDVDKTLVAVTGS